MVSRRYHDRRRYGRSRLYRHARLRARHPQARLAGTAVPVTGFGNAVIASAIEHRTEGFVLGVGSNMFKLAGPVIMFGVFAAFIIALIKTTLTMWGVL